MASVSVGVNVSAAKALQDALAGITFRGRSASVVGMQAALSRTIDTGGTEISRDIGEQVNLRKRDIDKVITKKKPSYEKLEGSITVTRKQSWLGDFVSSAQISKIRRGIRTSKQKKLQIRVRKKPYGEHGTVETIERAFAGFVPRNPNKIGVFQRQGKKRLPLRRMPGPSALGVFLNAAGDGGKKLADAKVDSLSDVLEKNVLSQIDRFLK